MTVGASLSPLFVCRRMTGGQARLAFRPGPCVSTLDSARSVKSAPAGGFAMENAPQWTDGRPPGGERVPAHAPGVVILVNPVRLAEPAHATARVAGSSSHQAGSAATAISNRRAAAACWGTTPLPMSASWRVREIPGTPVTRPGIPIIHSANAADSFGLLSGPGSAGDGAGYPRTCTQRRIAGSYSLHAPGPCVALDDWASATAAVSRPLPLWCPLPGRPPRRPCPLGEQPVSGVGSSRKLALVPGPDGEDEEAVAAMRGSGVRSA